jgi:tetratricopeptide (TPR) repeat protein
MGKTVTVSPRNFCVFLLFAFFVLIVYSNTFNASWQLDDYHNIVNNPWLHINNLYPESLKNTFYASPDGGQYNQEKIYRPVPMLSFALNWYYGKNDVTGYHVVNTVIHIVSAFILFLAISNIFKAPNIKEKYRTRQYPIALLAAAIWMIHPIQTQAVTYIVQRMASMAGMFYIAALYMYIKARLSKVVLKRTILFVFSFLLFLLAVASKQNAAMLPFIIVIMEFVFFQDLKKKNVRIQAFFLSGVIILMMVVAGTCFFLDNNLFSFLDGYSKRSFTLAQRLLTEPRIIVFYLYQIFYPIASHFSIGHDIVVSKSLFSPWTTFPSILLILSILGAGFYNITKRPVLSFSIFFFFINHVIESTIIPLELIFEHRNYIPTMFIFVPVAIGICSFFDNHKKNQKKKVVYFVLTSGIIFVTAMGTYARNFDWLTVESLWQTALNNAPGNARPYQNLALHYYRTGQYDRSIELLEKSINLKDSKPDYSKMVTFNNLALNYIRKKKFHKAVEYAEKAVSALPAHNTVKNYITALIRADNLELAEINANDFIEKHPKNMDALNLKTIVLLKKQRYREAEETALRLVQAEPYNIKYLSYFGIVHLSMKNYTKANYYLSKAAMNRSPYRILIYFSLIENSINAGNSEKTKQYINEMLTHFSIIEIKNKIESIHNNKFPIFPVPSDLAENLIVKTIKKQSETLLIFGKTDEE